MRILDGDITVAGLFGPEDVIEGNRASSLILCSAISGIHER